jgi:hypothetical protein
MTTPDSIQAAVQRIAAQYRSRGFDVVVSPEKAERPDFLADFKPDLIARKPGEAVVVEVKRGTDVAHGARLQPIAERIAQHPGWKFSLVMLDESGSEPLPTEKTPLPVSDVAERITRALDLAAKGSPDASFLLLWSSVEALLRNLAERSHLPVERATTSVLLRELYSAGEISRDQFESAMRMLLLRNTAAHGFVSRVGTTEAAELHVLAEKLLSEVQRERPGTAGAV